VRAATMRAIASPFTFDETKRAVCIAAPTLVQQYRS
jgi:hypothetical protein